ncbi:hypothetical protein Tco_0300587 [Tanacetum coccineum]
MSGTQDDNPPPPPQQSTQQTPTQQTPYTVSTIKLPILKKGEYDIWVMKMEHYLAHTDYPIWEVIQNGNGPVFEGFTVSNSDGIHKGYERFQSLLSQLEIHGAGVSTEDANQKFLRSLPSAWLSSTASSSNLQNVAFVSENTNSTNDVSTAYGVSNTSGHNSKLEQTSSYSLLASQSSCPQLDHEDLDQKDGRKFSIDAKELLVLIKTKSGMLQTAQNKHFCKVSCRTKEDNRRRDGWNPGNKDGSRTGKKEESKALVTVDGESVDWTTHSEDDENYAFMAANSSGQTTCNYMLK